jgi:ABC-2 type transport system permease protein
MLETLKHYVSYALYCLKLSVQLQMEYATYMVCWLIMIPIQFFSGFYMLRLLIEKVGALNGWGYPEVAFLYGLALMSHGFQDLLFIQTRNIEYMVLYGEFDRLLLRPIRVFFQFCFMNFNIVGFFDMIPGLVIFLYGCNLLHFVWSPLNILYLAAITFGGTLIRAAVYTITGSIAFWTKKSGMFVALNLSVFERTTMYPLTIYPLWFRMLFTFLIPLAFVSFYPVSGMLHIGYAVSFPLPLDLVIWCPLVGILFFAVARAFFHFGLRRKYESAGS